MNCVSGLFRGDMGAKSIALSCVTESIKRMTQQICNARSRLYKSAAFVYTFDSVAEQESTHQFYKCTVLLSNSQPMLICFFFKKKQRKEPLLIRSF